MKIIIAKKLYPKLGIINDNIRYIKNISFTDFEWIQKDVTMHSPINILINFNDFIENNINYKT